MSDKKINWREKEKNWRLASEEDDLELRQIDKETKLEYENRDLKKSIDIIINVLKAHYGFQIVKRKHKTGSYILNLILPNGFNQTVYLTDDESSKLIQSNMVIKNIINNEMFCVRK